MVKSLPSRERGLKSVWMDAGRSSHQVAPLAGARIEMMARMESTVAFMVAPLAGARIEIINIARNGRTVACRSPRGSAD